MTDWNPRPPERSVRLLDIRAGSCVYSFLHDSRSLQSLAYSPGGLRLLIQNGFDVNILTLDTKACEWMRAPGEDHGRVMAFLPEGESFISRYSHCFRIWDTEELRSSIICQEPQSDLETIGDVAVNNVAISLNGQYLVSDNGSCIRLWCLPDGTYEGYMDVHLDTIEAFDDVRILSFSSDSESLILRAKNMVYVWVLRESRQPTKLALDSLEFLFHAKLIIYSCDITLHRTLSPVISKPVASGTTIRASWAHGGTVAIHNNNTAQVWKLQPVVECNFVVKIPDSHCIMAVAIWANDKYLSVVYGANLQVWDLTDEQAVAMAFSADVSILAFTSFHTVWIWTTVSSDSPRCLFQHEIPRYPFQLPPEEFPTRLPVLMFAPTSNTLVAAVSYPIATVILWDVSSGLEFVETKPRKGGYSSLLFSKDETHVYLKGQAFIDCYRIKPDLPELASRGSDREMRISFDEEWIYRNGQKFLKFTPEDLTHISYSKFSCCGRLQKTDVTSFRIDIEFSIIFIKV
ncbi:G beta WD-40 repeats containing protein [Fusarium pseudocircinatum]|uniref:G beta WD-40 repeats containing protein n=1 Tax=Fusarium pseudocircinatum TaxID=56676 RepID=A0A8H5NWD1_9HYPO|nr:G beta WD-40 repeats containing protein [Fusarium pseudocircinatum]